MHHIPCFFLQINMSVRHVIFGEMPFCLLQKERTCGCGDPPLIEQKRNPLQQGHVPPEADTIISHNYEVSHENDCYPICFATASRLLT